MRPWSPMLRLAVLLLLPAAPGAMRAQQAPRTPPPVLEQYRAGFTEITGYLVRAAEMVPEDRYGFRPVETVRTIGQMFGHIADGNNYYCPRAGGTNPEWAETVALSNASKAEIIAQLRRSIDACLAAHAPANNARSMHLLANLSHVSQHYGNIVTYLRIMGLTPPSTQ